MSRRHFALHSKPVRYRLSTVSFLKFSIVGAGGTALHYLLLVLAVELAFVPAAIASVLGASAGALFNYFLNQKFTFESKRSHRHAFPRFASVAILGVLVNGGVVYLGTLLGAHYLASQVVATAIVLLIGYLLNALWTF